MFSYRRQLRRIRSYFVLKMVQSRGLRRILNAWYLRLGPEDRAWFHTKYAWLLRGQSFRGRDDTWQIAFNGSRIRLPLRAKGFALDWEVAVAIAGHDIEVKQSYLHLLQTSHMRPDVFLDVGANFGTHSLLFLTQGIETITCEPNQACHDYFLRCCELNGVTCDLHPVAVGDSEDEIELHYPEGETWFGSTDPQVVDNLRSDFELLSHRVSQVTLDGFTNRLSGKRVLIKIDTEGNELSVLRGAADLLRSCRPTIILEWTADPCKRESIIGFFRQHNYCLQLLPLDGTSSPGNHVDQSLVTAKINNVAALPVGDVKR